MMADKKVTHNDQNTHTPEIRFKGFSGAWEDKLWFDTVNISTNMVDPRVGKYDELFHVGPGNIESFSGRIYDNVLSVKNSRLISGKFHFNKGDIIYGKINPQLAKYTIAPFEGLASADSYVLNAKNGTNKNYLYSILQTEDFFKYSVSVSARTGMPKINREELNAYNYKAPKNSEQKKIGNYFQRLDSLITQHQKKHDKLLNLKKSLLEKMFPKQGNDVPEIRFNRFQGEWEEEEVGKIAEITIGEFVIKTKQNPNSLYPVFNGGRSNTGFYHQYNNEGNKIVISARGANAGYVNIQKERFWAGNSCYSLDVIEKSNYDTDFIYYVIKKNQNKFTDYQQAANIPSVSKNDVNVFQIVIPKFKEQKKIGTLFKQLDTLISQHQTQIKKLKNIKRSCLEKMFV